MSVLLTRAALAPELPGSRFSMHGVWVGTQPGRGEPIGPRAAGVTREMDGPLPEYTGGPLSAPG